MKNIILGKTEKGKNVEIDLKTLLRTRALIQANSGGGKSYLIRRLAEQFFGKVQVIIIDREGEFSTLREKFGYLLVGQDGDTPADVRSARLLAEKILELGVSAVCDLYEAFRSNPNGRREWVANFLEALIDAPKSLWHDLIVFVDEAHLFCPESMPKAGTQQDRAIISRCKDAMISLATVGRKRSFCAIWATQRLAKLDKDATSELFNRLIGMTIEDVDVDRAVDLMSVSKEDRAAFKKTLRELEPGNFFAFGRAVSKERVLVKIGSVATTHPEPGSQKYAAGPPPAPEKIRHLLPKLADLPKEAETKAKTEAELKAEILSLKKQLSAKVVMPKVLPAKEVEKVVKREVKIPMLHGPLVGRIHKNVKIWNKALNKLKPIEAIGLKIAKLNEALMGKIDEASKKLSSSVVAPVPKRILPVTPPSVKMVRPVQNGIVKPEAGEVALLAGERKMLEVLAQAHPLTRTRTQIAQLTGYTASGGTFGNYYGHLKRDGYLEEKNGSVQITEKGIAYFGDQIPDGPKSQQDVISMWKDKLLAGERKMLDVLLQAYPDAISKEDLGQQSGYESSGGTFGNYLGTLRRNDLVSVEKDFVKAANFFFENGKE